ncbi:YbaB/EbfC DNA-binding family protein [Amycolatopsis xylanica]|uniref:YbaB/EbfC DNA-binding family protein n=1 Tax=Amycolatopsis xylanica TaxID=589385 RepID=A0A1H3AP43_9PSEU|nr:YbaB/EbfC family nucleoid-associated protein [Amycolatopsis xylanica]SDX31467.1 YbaB/EbfC DNA-binding family protein [Amycolatopsis xylanica]
MASPEQLFTDYDAKLKAAQEKADRLRSEMDGVSVTERTKDGLTVTVNHAGNLTNLEISTSAREKPTLAQDIMRTVQLAQSKLAEAVSAGVPSAGPETRQELVAYLHDEFPEPPQEGYVEGGFDERAAEESRFVPEAEVSTPKPPPRPARPAPVAHDDDYFDGGFLR